jgi:hypothetical protein
MSDRKIILTHPDGGETIEKAMTIAQAEKMLSCRTTSKKWGFKDENISFDPKEKKINIKKAK